MASGNKINGNKNQDPNKVAGSGGGSAQTGGTLSATNGGSNNSNRNALQNLFGNSNPSGGINLNGNNTTITGTFGNGTTGTKIPGSGGETMIAPNYTIGNDGNTISNVVEPRRTITDNGNGSANGGGSSGNGISGVSSNTQAQLDRIGNGYQAGQNVSNAQGMLDQILNQKPGEYTSRYDDQIQQMLTGLTDGSRKFDYNFADDELFKYYSDLYQQQGRQASLDAMGQAAAMTGGYGNSYAESVANQANQQYLTQLYDKGLEFRDRAYQQYQDELANDYNRLGLLQQAENQDYGRYRDLTGDWRTDRDYYTGRTDTESDRDYQRWADDRNYWNTIAQQENQDYWTGRNFDQSAYQFDRSQEQNQRQFDANMAENQRQFDAQMAQSQQQYDRNMAANYITSIISNGQMPSEELLMAAGLSREDAKKMIQQIQQAGGGSSGGGGGSSGGGGGNNGAGGGNSGGGGNGSGWIQRALDIWKNVTSGATNAINDAWNRWQNQGGKPGVAG